MPHTIPNQRFHATAAPRLTVRAAADRRGNATGPVDTPAAAPRRGRRRGDALMAVVPRPLNQG